MTHTPSVDSEFSLPQAEDSAHADDMESSGFSGVSLMVIALQLVVTGLVLGPLAVDWTAPVRTVLALL